MMTVAEANGVARTCLVFGLVAGFALGTCVTGLVWWFVG